jgi:uncharacterized protein YyaL (SSP411 family)
VDEIARRQQLKPSRIQEILESAKKKMYAARLQRPTPFVDKTVYVSWNALCISAYLKAAAVLKLDAARKFALRSLDRIFADAWTPENGLKHVVAYSDGIGKANGTGFLDDYAFTVNACLDAYETTADLSYFTMAKRIGDQMIERLYDPACGGFLDGPSGSLLGVLGTARKPFQDSPTPAGNPSAAIALLRLHTYTDERSYRTKAEKTLQLLAGVAGQYGLFAATYGIALMHLLLPQSQIVVVGEDETALQLYAHATSAAPFGASVLKLAFNQVVSSNLPPALAQTIPHLPFLKEQRSAAVVCSAGSCKPPAYSLQDLRDQLEVQAPAA